MSSRLSLSPNPGGDQFNSKVPYLAGPPAFEALLRHTPFPSGDKIGRKVPYLDGPIIIGRIAPVRFCDLVIPFFGFLVNVADLFTFSQE